MDLLDEVTVRTENKVRRSEVKRKEPGRRRRREQGGRTDPSNDEFSSSSRSKAS